MIKFCVYVCKCVCMNMHAGCECNVVIATCPQHDLESTFLRCDNVAFTTLPQPKHNVVTTLSRFCWLGSPPPRFVARVALVEVHVGTVGVLVGSTRYLRNQHVGIGNVKWLTPNASHFPFWWNIGLTRLTNH